MAKKKLVGYMTSPLADVGQTIEVDPSDGLAKHYLAEGVLVEATSPEGKDLAAAYDARRRSTDETATVATPADTITSPVVDVPTAQPAGASDSQA